MRSTGTFFRRLSCISIAALLFCAPGRAADLDRESRVCIPDRARLLALDLNTFDQKPEGWRGVKEAGAGCETAAADLIAEYRKARPEVLDAFMSYLLYWHEGQIRAANGQYKQAAELFAQSRLPADPKFDMWNLYVDASLAFLDKDRAALLKAREAMAAMPPEAYKPLPKPLNLDVVDGLVACFERSYRDAYGTCRSIDGKQP